MIDCIPVTRVNAKTERIATRSVVTATARPAGVVVTAKSRVCTAITAAIAVSRVGVWTDDPVTTSPVNASVLTATRAPTAVSCVLLVGLAHSARAHATVH